MTDDTPGIEITNDPNYTPNHQKVTLDFREVHETSIEMLEVLEDQEVTLGVGVTALALSVGRLISQRPLTQDEEHKWIQDFLDWSGAYWTTKGGES